MSDTDSTRARRLEVARRLGVRLSACACAAAAMPLGLTVEPSPAGAKAPGVTHCYRSVCHRVRTVEQTRRLIGRSLKVETSYYDMPGVDRFNTGTYTSNGERFDANDSARVASADLPDGTELLLRNPVNGRVSHVRVNDFGPFRGDRRLDVTRRVAEDLDFKHKGVVRLEIIVIAAPADEDLTYRRNRTRRTTRGHLGVVFEPEMPALVADLVAERNPAPEIGPAIAAVEVSRQPSAATSAIAPADVVAIADTQRTDSADYERLADTGSHAPEPDAPPSHTAEMTVAVLSDEADAHPAPAAEPAASAAEPIATSPARQTALAEPTALAALAPEATQEAAAPATDETASPASEARPAEGGNLARAVVATSDFGGALSLPWTSRNLLLVMLAGLLSATLAASLSAGHRMSRRSAPSGQPGALKKALMARSGSEDLPPVASLSEPAPSSVRHDNPGPAVRAASFLGADFAIEGQVRSTGRIEIAGRIKGRIEADEIIIVAGGVVEGDVICRVLAVAGTITGAITAHEVHVNATGRVDAVIETGIVTVERGAWFEGEVRRRQIG